MRIGPVAAFFISLQPLPACQSDNLNTPVTRKTLMPVISYPSGRTATTMALTLLVGVFLLLSAREGISNFYALLANQELTHPSLTDQRFREEGGTRALHYLTESLRYSPDNAWALEEMGALQTRRLRIFTGPLQALTLRNAGVSANLHLHKALLERPTSPYIWANLALAKLAQNEIDGELSQALRRADDLGPWEPDVQKIVFYVSLAVWDRLDQEQQDSVLKTMQRGAKRDAKNMLSVAKYFGRNELICAINKYNNSAVDTACNTVTKQKTSTGRSSS